MPNLYHFVTFSAFHRHQFFNCTCCLCLHAITLSIVSYFTNSMCQLCTISQLFKRFTAITLSILRVFSVYMPWRDKVQNRKFTKQTFTNTLCLQNKIQKFTITLCLQNKTKVYKHVMFTKQNTKKKVYEVKIKFTNTLYLKNKNVQTSTNTICLQDKILNKSLQTR